MKRFVRNVWDYLKVTPLGRWFSIHRRLYIMSRRGLALKAINDFGYASLSRNEKELLLADMVECAKKYRFSYGEYFRFHLKNKSDIERRSFVSDSDIVLYVDRLNEPRNHRFFTNKALAATTFANFFQREYCECKSANDAETLAHFLIRHKKVIVKPIASCAGIGIKLVELSDERSASEVARELINEYCASKYSGAIIEELIVQDERMAALHPESVNTVRITTIRLNDRTVIFHPNLRIGRGDSVVDNAGAGGILAPVDSETGRVIAAGDKNGFFYKTHPETGVQLEGFEVPCWQEAVEFVGKLAQVVPSNRCTGWDIALSKTGWVLVEANSRGQWGGQIVLQQGFRDEIESYLKELGLKSPFAGKVTRGER